MHNDYVCGTCQLRSLPHRPAQVEVESDPQGKPRGLRQRDRGASEGRSVADRIGVEPPGDITPRRKPADFPVVFRHERTLANRPQGLKQICQWLQSHLVRLPKVWRKRRTFRWLQARIVKVSSGLRWSACGSTWHLSSAREVVNFSHGNQGSNRLP